MSIKKIVYSLVLISSFLGLNALDMPTNTMPLLDYPTEEELKKVQEILDTLTPEEIEELSKIGEEIIRAAEQEGRPLFGPAPTEQPKPVQPTPKEEPKPAKPKEEPKESSIPKKQLSQLQKMLADLVDNLGEIRQKASTDEKLALMLEPVNKTLNSIAYYIRTIAYSKHTSRLAEKDFIQLKNSLTSLGIELDDINNQLDIDEIDTALRKQIHKTSKLQRAESLLKKFVDLFSPQKIQQTMTDLEAFMKKYEPEALEIRKKQEAQEKDASAFTKKLPVTNAGIAQPQLPTAPQDQRPSAHNQGTTGVKFGAPVYGTPNQQVQTAKPAGQTAKSAEQSGGQAGGNQPRPGQPTKKAEPKKDDKKEDKKEDLKERPLTIPEQAAEIRKRIAALDRRVATNKNSIDTFFRYLDENPHEATPVEQRTYGQAIGDVTYEAIKIKKSIDKWAEAIGKTAEWSEARTYRDAMQQVVDNGLGEFKKLIAQVSDVVERPTARKTRRISTHEEDLKELQKVYKDLSNIKIKPK